MINDAIVTQWSNAFFQLVVEEKQVKKYNHEAVVAIDLLSKYPIFTKIIDSPVLSLPEKNEIIRTTFSAFSTYMVNFFLLLAQENCFRYSLKILKEFRKQCNAYYGIQYGVVYSVVALNSQQIKKLEKKISLLTNSTIELVNKIDDSLIAGVKVKVKNQVFDGSIKGQIDQLKNNLLRNNQE